MRPSNKYGFGGKWKIGGRELSDEVGSGLNMAIGTGAGILGSALGGGYDSGGAGSAVRALGNAASAIPGPWGAALGAGLNLVGGFVDRAFGVKWNQENINKVQGNINALKGFSSNAGTWDSLQSNIETMPSQMTFSNSFIGSNGWFNHKADNRAERMRNEQSQAFNYAQNAITNNASNIASSQAQTLARNYVANGGPIQILGNGVMSPFGARYAKGGVLKNPLSSNGVDWNIGLTSINNGGSHERNPYEGVQIGVDQQGTPNLVEEGEVIWNDYVFSNRMKVPKKLREQLKLGKNDMTYAEAVNSKKKEREERPNDPIEKRGFEAFLTRLGTSQEQQRQKAEARRAQKEAQRIAQQQALTGGISIPRQSPIYDEQVPQEQEMQQTQQQEPEQSYAKGGKLGNLFLGWGPYGNNLTFGQQTWLRPRYAGESNRVRSPFLEASPYSVSPYLQTRLDHIYNTDNMELLYKWYNKYNDPNYNNNTFESQEIKRALGEKISYMNNLNSSQPTGPTGKLNLSITPPKLNTFDVPRLSKYRTVNQPLDATTPQYFFPTLNDKGEVVKGKGRYDEGFKNWVTNLTQEQLNGLNDERYKDYVSKISNGQIPALDVVKKSALDNNPGPLYNALSRLYYETEGRPTSVVENRDTKYIAPPLVAGGMPRVQDMMDRSWENPLFEGLPSFKEKAAESIGWQGDWQQRVKDDYNQQIQDWAEGKAADVVPQKYDTSNNIDNNSGTSNWLANLRYIPALGNAISVFTDLMGWTNKPDYTNANAVLEASRGVRDVRFNPIGDYLTYRPLDRMFYQNQLNAQAGATQRNIINTSGNRGSAMAGLLASGYNAMNSQGNLARQSEEYNEAQRQQVAQFNRETNKFNSQMDLEAQRANLGASEVRMNAALNAAKLRDAIDARVGASRSANLTNLFDSIGDIGREEFTRNMINSNRAQYYTIDRLGGIHYKPGYYALSDWEKRYQEDMARRDSRAIQGNGSYRPYGYSYGGYLTIKRRR